MPYTPYHFGPSAALAIPLHKYLDIPVFVLANVVVDLEPLMVIVFRLSYPVHGYLHTFLIGAIVGALWGFLYFIFLKLLKKIFLHFHLNYKPPLKKLIISGIFGVWLHVLFDAFLYADIKPFFPLNANPLLGLISASAVYWIIRISFILALIFTVIVFIRWYKKRVT